MGTTPDLGRQPGATFPTTTAAELPTGPNPLPPAGTTANMILRGANTSPSAGQYEIYNISNNAILTSYSLGQVRTNWQFVGLGGFYAGGTSGLVFRHLTAGAVLPDRTANHIPPPPR